jgi:hypothetical protein
MRPGGMSDGSAITLPPLFAAVPTIASVSSTAKYVPQVGGMPSIGGFIAPATARSPSMNVV